MTQTARRSESAVAALATVVAVFVALPVALVSASRFRFGSWNPLADVAPPWRWSGDAIGNALTEPLRDDAVVNLIVRSALTVAWIALVVIAVTTVAELVHMVRHRGMPAPRVRGVGWAQPIARFIAAGLIAVLPSVSSGHVSALGGTGDGAVATALSSSVDDAADPGSDRTAAFEREVFGDRESGVRAVTGRSVAVATHVVRQGESVWGIAARLGERDDSQTMEIAEEILDINLGRTMPDGQRFTNPALIRAGWVLELPASATPTGERDTASPAGAETGGRVSTSVVEDAPDRDGADDHVAYVVVDGDTMSEIADEQLGDADRWPEIFATNSDREMSDGRTLVDPDLILPGWELEIPTDGDVTDPGADAGSFDDAVRDVDATVTVVEEPDRTDTSEEPPASPTTVSTSTVGDDESPGSPRPTNPAVPSSTAAETGAPTSEPVETPSTNSPATAPEGAPPGPTPPPATTTPAATPIPAATTTTTTTTGPPIVDLGDASATDTTPPESPSAPNPIRIEHAALLAAGVLTLIGIRRQRRLRAAMPRARVPAPPDDVAATERRLRTIEPGEGAARLDIALRAAAHHLAESGAQIGLVRLADDGRIALRLTAPGRLDAPWNGLGTDWWLPANIPIELLAADARRAGAPCHALVAIGRDADGTTVLVDLEAAGVTAIEARDEQADDIVRAIATGLASSLHSEVVHLVTASLGSDCLLGQPNAHHRPRVGAAIDLALTLSGSTTANERSTFDLRSLRTGGEMWEPAVVLLGSDDRAGERLSAGSLPGAGHGLGVVASVHPGELLDCGARIEAHADRWELHAFGERTTIEPIGVGVEDVAELSAVLADAATPVIPGEISPATGTEPVDEPFVARPHEIVVGLLGSVEVRDRNGEVGHFERSKTVELIAWLATHRDRSTRTAARTALWELDVRDATFANVVSEARRALGRLVTPPEGEEWVARTLSESLPLHGLVVTDADLVHQRLDHARLAAPSHAIDVLRPAVEMIREMPFAGTSYLWPDADGITSSLVLLATTVTAELAAHALSVGDTETVFWATGHGLRVLPGHEELIALRMRAHARAGDLAGVRQEWESYERVIVADAWSDGEPAPKLLDLRRELLSPSA